MTEDVSVSISINGEEYLHISDFASTLGRSVPSTRYLIENGNSIRHLASTRIGSRLYIPKFELTGYPFALSGPAPVKDIYHYVLNEEGKYVKRLCTECTYGQGCQVALEAAEKAKKVPKGDL